MLHIIFMYIHLMYIALTESLFLQITTILIFHFASKFAYASTKNWYGYENTKLSKEKKHSTN